jgi:Uma2 family endonuclease
MTVLAAPLPPKEYTADDLLQLPDATGFELVHGQLRERTVSKESSRVAATIVYLLSAEARRTNEAEVYGADLGYNCFPPDAEKETRRGDVSLIRRERLAGLKGHPDYMPIPADLVVKVLSPNDLIRNVNDKVEEYLAAGFGLVWVVDPVKKHVMVHRRDGSVAKVHENEEISGESALANFKCKVAELLK